jgi:hypothetical protein
MKMTRDKVKEIIESFYEGEWKENQFVSNGFKDRNTPIDDVTVINLLLEQNYISFETQSESVFFPIITLN